MRTRLSLVIIFCCLPFILWGVCGILPTFDDYTSLQSPWQIQIADPGYFFSDAVRRPFDYLLGCIVGYFPSLFPTLNHVLIILGHTASTMLLFAICRQLNIGMTATNIATLFFFFSPATLGATLACDGFNQTYAQLWGLLALWLYLKPSSIIHYPLLSIACVVMAALSKESGLAWAIVPPLVAYGFRLIERRQALRHVGVGLLIALAYFVVYATIYYSGILGIEYDEQYTQATWQSHLRDILQLMAYTWVPVDYVSLVYPPSRNWTIVIVTFLLSLPFLLLLFSQWRQLTKRRLTVLILCFFIVASPHLVTLISIMHNYAALSIAALIVATLLPSPFSLHPSPSTLHPSPSTLQHSKFLFFFFLAAAIFTDLHHYLAARQSGLLGKQLAMQVIQNTETPPLSAFCINIDDDAEPRYSNFCVRPVDSFAWGLSVRHYSHYQWKTAITEATLPHYDQQQIEELADSALNSGCDAVWVVGHDHKRLTIIHHEQK